MSTDGGKHCLFGVDFGVDVEGDEEVHINEQAGRFGVEGVTAPAILVAVVAVSVVAATVVAVDVVGNAAIVVVVA